MDTGDADPRSSARSIRKVGFFGPFGTFTEQAVRTQADLSAAELVDYATVPDVLDAVAAGEVDCGVVPIENSIEGTVNFTQDALAFDYDLLITREIVLDIEHCLVGAPGLTLDGIKAVVSIPVATAQCHRFLRERLRSADVRAASSTAGAARIVAEGESGAAPEAGLAAIAPRVAAVRYGLDVIVDDIADHDGNQTRFVVVARELVPRRTGHDRTAMVVYQRADAPGSLLSVLQEFAARRINLSNLVSRPTKDGGLGDYCFVIYADAHVTDELLADALRALHSKQGGVKFLGSYPIAGAAEHHDGEPHDARWQAAEEWGRVTAGEGVGRAVTDTSRTTAGSPIAIANGASGTGADGDDADAELDAWCRRHGIERRDPGDDLEGAVRDAAGGHPPYVAVVGGDGTLRTAASVLSDGDVPLLPVPGGTFNHFARSLSIDDLDAASAAIESGRVRSVPVAAIDDPTSTHVFLNTCAIGWYPEMVRTRERLRERWPRPLAAAAAFAAHLPRLRKFTVEVDSVEHRAWLLWAGNGRYGTGLGDVTERESLDAGVLDVRVALADARFARTRVVADLFRGRLDDSDRLERTVTARPVVARFARRQVTGALDAEVVELRSPFTFVPAARWLPVLVPPAGATADD